MTELSPSAKRVQDVLAGYRLTCRVVELPALTRSAPEAAEAMGCDIAQIAKSMVFRGAETDEPLLVIASGANRVSVEKLAGLAGETILKADADFVRERTGFAIGGVAPVGHTNPLRTWIDRDLLNYEAVWAAAGTPRALFSIRSKELVEVTGGVVADTSEGR